MILINDPQWVPHTTDRACIWEQDDDGVWETECGEAFVVTEDTPRENGMVFCCYCGRSLEQLTYVEAVE